MRTPKIIAGLFALGLALIAGTGPNSVNWTCKSGTSGDGNCVSGQVTFSGNGYPNLVHITITRSSNSSVYDNFDYDASQNNTLNFTETLSPPDTYVVVLTDDNSGQMLDTENIVTE